MGGERCSEVGGLQTLWRVRRGPIGWIEVSEVRDRGAAPGQVVEFAAGTDLAEVRERYPRWNRLWDVVQHEFWADVAAVSGSSPATVCRDHSGGERPR